MNMIHGKVYVRSSKEKDYVYDPKEGRWDVAAKEIVVERRCTIEKVSYFCGSYGCFWYDTKRKEWRVVKGLEVFNRNCRGGIIKLVNYGGKLLVLWDRFKQPDDSQNKNIWCSVIALEKRDDDEVWGNVERTNVVLTVASSYVFLRCNVIRF